MKTNSKEFAGWEPDPHEASIAKTVLSMPKCLICDKEFEAQRSDAHFCSGRCRQRAKRSGLKIRPFMQMIQVNNLPENKERILQEREGFPHTPTPENLPQDGNQFSASPGNPYREFTYQEYLKAAPGIQDKELFKQAVKDNKKLTGPQKSMIYAKLK